MPGLLRNFQEDEELSDAESDLVSISSDDFPSYFIETNGRLFHSSTAAPYPLPVDTNEQRRLDVQNNILRTVIGHDYVGPVPELLAPVTGRHKFVVDFCCGSGKWILNMAALFPDVTFIGFDIVPITTRYPPENVSFEIHDITLPTRFEDGTIDFVHARDCSMTVSNYARLVQEASRILRRGGMFEFGEFLRFPAFLSTTPLSPHVNAPQFCRFYELLNYVLRQRRGLHHISDGIPTFLAQSQVFHSITPVAYHIPIGDWHEDARLKSVGRAHRRALSDFMDSARPFLELGGVQSRHLDTLYVEVRAELLRLNQLKPVTHYFTGFAFRL